MTLAELLIDEQLPDWAYLFLKKGNPIENDGEVMLDATPWEGATPHFIIFKRGPDNNLLIEQFRENKQKTFRTI